MAGRMNRLLAVLISAVTVTSSVNFTAMGTKAADGVNNEKRLLKRIRGVAIRGQYCIALKHL